MFLAELTNSSKDIWDILQILVLPIVLLIIPLGIKSFRDQKRSSEEVSSAAETVKTSGESFIAVLSTLEQAFLHIGKISSDVRRLEENFAELKDAFINYIESDADFMEMVTEHLTKVNARILENIDRNAAGMKQIDEEFRRALSQALNSPAP